MAFFKTAMTHTRHILSRRLFSSSTTTTTTVIGNATTPTFKSAKAAILSERDPEKLAKLIEENCQHATFLRHRPLFKHSLHKLSRSNRPDLMEKILNSQLNNTDPKFLKSEGFCIRILMIYSRAGMVDHAFKTLDVLVEKRLFKVSEKTLCAILSVCLDNGLLERVHQVFDTMPMRLGVTPGVDANNLKLKAFVKEGKVKDAVDWISKMERGKGTVNPSISSYNVVLGGCLDRRDFSTFDSVLKGVLKKGNGFEHNVVTYNYRIARLCEKQECVEAKKLLDEMVVKGVMPNTASYNSVINGFCRSGDFDSPKKVLESMVATKHVCSSPYYSLLRGMVNVGDLHSALGVAEEILNRKWVPPFEPMEGLINGLAKVSKVDQAKDVVQKMKKMLKGDALQSWEKIQGSLPL